MHWQDEGYLLSKTNYSENSIIIEVFTLNHGKYSGIVYGGSSRKNKKYYQIGNKILLNWNSKNENKTGYFSTEIIKPISPLFFDDKKKSISFLSATSLLKILLPDRQINKNIYHSFQNLIDQLNFPNWIQLYILWELSLVKELGFEISSLSEKKPTDQVNDIDESSNKFRSIPRILLDGYDNKYSKNDIKEALEFNKNLFMENIILPNHLRFPFSRNLLEKYYN